MRQIEKALQKNYPNTQGRVRSAKPIRNSIHTVDLQICGRDVRCEFVPPAVPGDATIMRYFVVPVFTDIQIEELVGLVEIRQDTIAEDMTSATEFETEENLKVLKEKLENRLRIDYLTSEEMTWIVEEAENRKGVGYGNLSSEGIKAMLLVNSMKSIVRKVELFHK